MVTDLLLVGHIVGVVLAVGPVAVAASRFPAAIRSGSVAAAGECHHTTRVYGTAALIVPALGVGLLARLDHLPGGGWTAAAALLSAAQFLVLFGLLIPSQARCLGPVEVPDLAPARRAAGLYNLAWCATIVVMVTKPWF